MVSAGEYAGRQGSGACTRWLLTSRARLVVCASILVAAFVMSFPYAYYSRPTGVTIDSTPVPVGEILSRNVPAAIYGLSGVITFGLTSVIATALQGIHLGAIVGRAGAAGLPSVQIAAGLMPHALVEYVAFLLIASCGLVPAQLLLTVAYGVSWRLFLRRAVSESVRALLWGTACLVVAALLEAFLTPAAIRWSQQ